MSVMGITRDSRYVRTEELAELNARAIERGYGRALDPHALLMLDPEGVHVITRIRFMFFPFARCEVLLKVANSMKPSYGNIDLSDDEYDELPHITEYLQALDVYDEQLVMDSIRASAEAT